MLTNLALRRLLAFADVRADVPEFRHPDDIRLRWSVVWWDGPYAGIAEVDGRLVWFQWIADIANEYQYGVFDLTDDEAADHVARHEILVQHWGTRNDFIWDDEFAVYRRGQVAGDGSWSSSADWVLETDERTEYDDREPIGWFLGVPRA